MVSKPNPTLSPGRIRAIMEKLGVDRIGLAKLLGASPRTVDGWLSRRPPSKIAAHLIEGLVRK